MKEIFGKFKKGAGFTIIELIVSIFILSVGLVGIFNALSVITILTSDSADRLTATYLGQEGMEIVRNIRDTNWLNIDNDAIGNSSTAHSWIDGLTINANVNSVACSSVQPCEADYTSTAMSQGDDYLLLNSDGFYVYHPTNVNPTTTIFKRKIIITPVTDVDGISSPYHILKFKVETSWNRKATILSPGITAEYCCPDPANPNCRGNVSNCVVTEETLYNWYNTAFSVINVAITDPLNANTKTAPTTLSLGGVNTDNISAKINPVAATNKNVSWSSSDPTVASVTDTGVDAFGNATATVTALKVSGPDGVTITVTTADGGKTDSEVFVVNN